MNYFKDIGKLHLAVMLFGLAGVIARYVTIPSSVLTFCRVALSSVFLLIILLIRKEKIKTESKTDLAMLVGAGLILALHWTAFFTSVKVASVAIGTITFSTFPIFVTFIEPVIFKERLKKSDILISLIMIVGVFVTVPQFSMENNVTAGIVWGMLSAFTYAVMSLMNRGLSSKYSGSRICMYEQGTAAIVLIPFAISFFCNPLTGSISLTTTEVVAIVFLGIVCTAIGHSVYISALKNVRVQTAGIISGMETVYGIIFAMILLHDMITVREVIGGIIILGASMYKTVITDQK